MRPLTDLFSRPRAVTVAEKTYLVGELTVGDVAELQAWLDRTHPDPLEAAGAGPYLDAEGVPPGERHRFALAADLAEEGPPVWGTARADAALATVGGAYTFLGVVLRRHQPELSGEDLVRLLIEAAPGEIPALRRAVFRTDPAEVLARALDRLAGVEPPPAPAESPWPWRDWVDRVARSHGYTYAEIEGLTLTQLFNCLSEGKEPEPGGRPEPDDAKLEEICRKRAAWLSGSDQRSAFSDQPSKSVQPSAISDQPEGTNPSNPADG